MRFLVFPRALGATALVLSAALIAVAASHATPEPNSSGAAAAPSAAAPGSPPPAAPARAPIRAYINGVPDTGQFLPDTTTLARVQDHRIRVSDFVWSYFNSYAEDRPGQDSLGRVSFLQSMVDKDVLGLTAMAAGYVPTFEDRIKMREHTERVLSNVLFQRAIMDSAQVTEAEIQHVYDQYKYEPHVRHILFADPETAERVRLDLLSGRINWKEAVKKYSLAKGDKGPDGDLGWLARINLPLPIAEVVYALKPNEISQVVEDENGPQLVQCLERRPTRPVGLHSVRGTIVDQIRDQHMGVLSDRLHNVIAQEIGFTIDSANVAWACTFFAPPMESKNDAGGMTLVLNAGVPDFSSADTSRVLARWKTGRLTLGGYMQAFSEISPLVRPNASTYPALAMQVANVVLEPYRAQIALRRGYDKDPRAVAQIQMKLEQIMVEHMYEDSIASRVSVTPAERRRYYEENRKGFFTYASRRYATILRKTKGAADSLVAELRAGRRAEDVVAADSAAGTLNSSIHDMREDEHGTMYRKLVYEELKPGGVTTMGPYKNGIIVVQLISVKPGRQLSYDEAQTMVDENVRNTKSEVLFKKMLERLRRRYRIGQRPELVMQVRLADPTI